VEETRHINSPEVLSNITCAYCGEDLSTETEDTEHVVGRRFVPKGSLDGAWNIILKACKRCNREKGDLEDDISAITMQPTVAGQFQDNLVGYTADGNFQVAIRQLAKSQCWSWALEWNRNLRVIGLLGDLTLAANLLSHIPQLDFDVSAPTTDGRLIRHRREEALDDADDCMFKPSNPAAP
jgi:hypothetical protein